MPNFSKNSLPTYAEQIQVYNANAVEMAIAWEKMAASKDSTVTLTIMQPDGTTRTSSITSIGYLKDEIETIKRNIRSLAGLGEAGSFLQLDGQIFKKIISVDLNKQPNDLGSLNSVSSFYSEPNYIFDQLLNPAVKVELDLTSKIDADVSRVQSRRFIVEFERDSLGELTVSGSDALADFTQRWKGRSDIPIADFLEWTGRDGVKKPVSEDLQQFELQPNYLAYSGTFDVLGTENDTQAQKLYYLFNRLEYLDQTTGLPRLLKVGDVLVINSNTANTLYRVREIQTPSGKIRVDLERVDGLNPVPVATDALRVYSQTVVNQRVRVSVGLNEYDVVFLKAINDGRILSDAWSDGVAFYTDELRLVDESGTGLAGITLQEYRLSRIQDYGAVLREIVEKRVPISVGAIPSPPPLLASNFKVVQIDTHLNGTADADTLRKLQEQQESTKSEIQITSDSVAKMTSRLQNFKGSEADRQKLETELKAQNERIASLNRQLASVVSSILSRESSVSKEPPSYEVQGFWDYPTPPETTGSREQQVIQFEYRFRYAAPDGQEDKVESFTIGSNDSTATKSAAMSNWRAEKRTAQRRGKYDAVTGKFEWLTDDLTNADVINTNQLREPIRPGEKMMLQVRSISEVGYPDSPLVSDWSEQIEIPFPAELSNQQNFGQQIVDQARQDDATIRTQTLLETQGVTRHVRSGVQSGTKIFHHSAKDIITEETDGGVFLDVQSVIARQNKRIADLETVVKRIKGQMEVVVSKGGKQYELKSGQQIQLFYTAGKYAVAQSPGKYYNRVYTLDESDSPKVIIRNVSADSPLGLVSYRTEEDALNLQARSAIRPVVADDNGDMVQQVSRQAVWVLNRPLQQSLASYADVNVGGQTPDVFAGVSTGLGLNPGYSTQITLQDKSLDSYVRTVKHSSAPQSANSRRGVATVVAVNKPTGGFSSSNRDDVFVLAPGAQIEIPLRISFCLDTNENLDDVIDLNRPVYANHVQKKVVAFRVEPENLGASFDFQVEVNVTFARPGSAGFGASTAARAYQVSRPTKWRSDQSVSVR